MQTHANREDSHANRAEAQGVNATNQFADQRPAAASQNRLAGLADSSPRATQLRTLQAMANASPGVETTRRLGMAQTATAQRQAVEEEEPLQGKFAITQREEMDDEEPLQGKFATAQRAAAEEDEVQMKTIGAPEPAAQLQAKAAPHKNETGLPDNLKSGIESLSGMSMDNVRVHYNSSKPAQLNAYAYAQGTDIHVGPGQEKHLPHEAWHVVQQAQGRVRPTMQMKGGVAVNDDAGLEGEADLMGGKALSAQGTAQLQKIRGLPPVLNSTNKWIPIQMATIINYTTQPYTFNNAAGMPITTNVGHVMTALLDPADPRKGSGPGGSLKILSRALRSLYPGSSIIKGHLLNDNLGGLGLPENLFPVTQQANVQHRTQVEDFVKTELYTNANTVRYRVQVNSACSHTAPQATLDCNVERALPGGVYQQLLNKQITSTPNPPPGGILGATTPVAPLTLPGFLGASTMFPTTAVAATWTKSGSGRRSGANRIIRTAIAGTPGSFNLTDLAGNNYGRIN